jgi:hypothetical protein
MFTPPKATGPSTNKKAKPVGETKQETAENPSGATQEHRKAGKE